MSGCTLQANGKLPGALKVSEKLPAFVGAPELPMPATATSCGWTGTFQVQVTVPPAATLTVPGLQRLAAVPVTVAAAGAEGGTGVGVGIGGAGVGGAGVGGGAVAAAGRVGVAVGCGVGLSLAVAVAVP